MNTRSSRFVISEPGRAGAISWQLAQTFWVGGLWLLQFVVLPALGQIGLAPLLVEEVASYLRPLLVGFAGFCVLLQALILLLAVGGGKFLGDIRGQLLLAVLLLAAGFFLARAGWFDSLYWSGFSILAMALCGVILVLQPSPDRKR